jgi:hypothetical protein
MSILLGCKENSNKNWNALEISDVIFSYGIISVLYNFYFIGQIDDLGTRTILINPTGGSTRQWNECH